MALKFKILLAILWCITMLTNISVAVKLKDLSRSLKTQKSEIHGIGDLLGGALMGLTGQSMVPANTYQPYPSQFPQQNLPINPLNYQQSNFQNSHSQNNQVYPNNYGTNLIGTNDAISQYIHQYGAAPKDGSHLDIPSKNSELKKLEPESNLEEKENSKKVESNKAEVNADDSLIKPEMIVELKKMIAKQQIEVGELQSHINELLEELKNDHSKLTEEKEQAKTRGVQNSLQLEIQFPEKEEKDEQEEKNNSELPTSSEKGMKTSKKQKSNVNDAIKVKEPIPFMILKSDALGDIESLKQQAQQEEEAKIANEQVLAKEPSEMQLLSPEERLDAALAKTDELEAKKGYLEAEIRIADKTLHHPIQYNPMGEHMFSNLAYPLKKVYH